MSNGTVRSLLLQLSGGQLLVPSAVIAEVLAYREPDEERDTPPWLLGMMRWRGEVLPLVSMEKILGIQPKDSSSHTRIVIVYGIYAPDKLPFYGLISKGMPSSVTVGSETLHSPKPVKRNGVTATVNIEDRGVWLPDFEYLEKLLQEAL